jgi:hypothetical protein
MAFVLGPPFLVLLAVIGLWYVVSYVLLDVDRRFLLPPPHAVIQVAFLDPYNLADLLDGLWLSTRVAFLGFAVAIVIGMALAIAMSQARWVERSLHPYAVMTQTIPILACVPLFGLWFGYSFPAGRSWSSSSRSFRSSPTRCSGCSRCGGSTTTCSPCMARAASPGCGSWSSRRRCPRSSPGCASRPDWRSSGDRR